jgi:hypothetical protein
MKYKIDMFLLLAATLLCGPSTHPTIAQTAGRNAVNADRILIPHPSWNCGMADGIPNPESGNLVFEAQLRLERVLNIGKTPYGNRQVAIAQDGSVSGTRLSGTVTSGALDFELKLANGIVEIEQILVFKSSDGKYIYARAAGVGADATDVRVVMDFEAPNASDSSWLNTGKYVARRLLNAETRTLTLRVYDVSAVAAPSGSNAIRISKPAGVPEQPWDYRKKTPGEKQGSELITETVTLSPSLSVGPSKRGNRNIIPITGGELSGRISGKVLPGGADYQNLSPPATIDARYLWQTSDGEIIIVRNAGTFGALVPAFEVRTDSVYAWLNTGSYLSSNPGGKPGGVGITMYDSVR